MHLANQAAMSVALERGKETNGEDDGEVEWKWEYGRRYHTFPGGVMSYIVGKRERVGSEESVEGN